MEWQPGILVFPLTEAQEGRTNLHARYRILSQSTKFELVLLQQLLPGTRSSLHLHPVPEVYITLSDSLTLLSLREGEEVKIQIPKGTVVRIQGDTPHGVMNETPQVAETLVLIGEGYRDEDKTVIRPGGTLPASPGEAEDTKPTSADP